MHWKQWLPSRSDRGASGAAAEAHAARHLQQQGLAVIDRNYRCKRGEIDLICRQGDVLVFVEVRLRNHHRFASGAESVDARKQHKLTLTAQHYLQKNYGCAPPACRFDVVSVVAKDDNGGGFTAQWLQDAFRPGG